MPNRKTKKSPVTFIRVNRHMELTRSPVDGMWRAWVRMPAWFFTDKESMDEEDFLAASYMPDRWVVAGVARKAKDAIEQARRAIGHD